MLTRRPEQYCHVNESFREAGSVNIRLYNNLHGSHALALYTHNQADTQTGINNVATSTKQSFLSFKHRRRPH